MEFCSRIMKTHSSRAQLDAKLMTAWLLRKLPKVLLSPRDKTMVE